MSFLSNVSQWISAEEANLSTLQGRFIRRLAFFILISTGIGILARIVQTTNNDQALDTVAIVVSLVVALMSLALLYLVDRGYVQAAALLLITTFVVLSLVLSTPFVLVALLALVAAAALGRPEIYIAANVLILGRLIVRIGQSVRETSNLTDAAQNDMILVLGFLVVSLVTRYFIRATQRASTAAERNALLLQAAAEITRETSRLLDLNEVLAHAVSAIQKYFGIQHVQIYLVNEETAQAILTAGSVVSLQQRQQARRAVPIGSQSIIGQVALRGEPINVRDIDVQSGRYDFRGEFLGSTRSELAVPITDGERIIGVLDVQSTRDFIFELNELQAFQVLANQLGTAIRNARLFADRERNVDENKRLFLEAQERLQEIRRLNQQLTKSGWDSFLQNQLRSVGITLEENHLSVDTDWTESLIQAAQRGQPVSRFSGSDRTIAVPILLRGEVIGAIEIEPKGDIQEADSVEMMQAVAQRLALSLDNARLFEEAQQATAQEQLINQITARYQSANSVDDLLQITLKELSDILGARYGSIRLVAEGSFSQNGGEAQ